MRRSSLFWGGILILLGGLLLIDNLGILRINFWGILGPLLLILIGVWVLAGYLIKEKPAASETKSVPLDQAKMAQITFHHGAGRLNVGANAAPEALLSGTFTGEVAIDSRQEGETRKVRLGFRSGDFPVFVFPRFLGGTNALNWDIRLNAGIPLDLIFKTGANEAHLDLAGLNVVNLRVETGASSMMINLPEQVAHTKAVIQCGVASVVVHIPEQVAAKIRFSGGLMNFRIDRSRFPKTAGVYQSPGYDSSPNRVELHIDGGIGSVSVR
jgi:hypothetical protein